MGSYYIIMKLIMVLFIVLLADFSAEALCVSSKRANLRSGPGTNFDKTWEVFQYMPLRKLKKKGSWYHVQDVEGDKHWISSKLVTSKYRCAVVKVDRANLRVGPGGNFKLNKKYPAAEKYASFRFLKSSGKWCQLKDEYGEKVWVFRKLVWVY